MIKNWGFIPSWVETLSGILGGDLIVELGSLQMKLVKMRVCPKSRMTAVLIRRGETQRCR